MRVLFLCAALLACQTTASLKPTAADKLDKTPDEAQLLNVPTMLWSPDQRLVSAIYNYLVGEYTLLQGDVHTAHAAFERAYGLDPDPFLGGKSIYTLAELGHTEVALTKSKKMTLLHPKDAYLRFLHGQILVRSGRLEQAQQQLQQALQLDALHMPSYHALIDLHSRQQRWQEALLVAQAMVREIPGAVHGWSKLSRIYLLLGQKMEALQAARTAFEMQSANPTLVLIYAYLLELNGHSQAAIAMYERLYQGNATNEVFISHLAMLYRQLGGLQQALELLDELARRAAQRSSGVDIQRVVILWELQDNQRAHAILAQLVEQHPEAVRVIYLMALSEERLNNDAAAVERYRQLLEDKELGQAARFRLAVTYRRMQNLTQAQMEMHHLIESGKTRWQFFAFLADIYNQQKNYRMALRITKLGIVNHPDTVPLVFAQGVYQEKTGDITGCMQTMRRVIALDPRHSNAHNYLGYLLAEQNIALQEALQLILRALELKPNNGYYLDSLAWVYYRLGEYDKAHDNILRALRLHPKESVILEHYADILVKLRHTMQALQIYRQALQYVENDKDRQRIADKLKQLINKNS